MLQRQMNGKKKMDLSSYQTYLEHLYDKQNRERDFYELYSYLDRSSAYIGKAILAQKITQADFILPISWLFSLSSKLGINLKDSFIRNYPGKCAHCLEKECVCLETGKKPLRDLAAYQITADLTIAFEYERNKPEPYNLYKAVENIKKIYKVNKTIWLFSGQWYHNFKVHEEIAEIHEAYVSYKKLEGEKRKKSQSEITAAFEKIGSEIADSMGWIIAAWGILFPKSSLDSTFMDYYIHGCPECHSEPCICEAHDSKVRSIIDFRKVTNIREQVNEIQSALPKNRKEIGEVIKSLNEAVVTQHDTTARKAVDEVNDLFEKVRNSVVESDSDDPGLMSSIDGILSACLEILAIEEQVAIKKECVFISYDVTNQDQARVIHKMIQKNRHEVFLSENMEPGENWEDVIKNKLKSTMLFVLIATPQSMNSEWVKREWHSAWMLDVKIVPVLYRLSPDQLPDLLRRLQAIDYEDRKKILELLK